MYSGNDHSPDWFVVVVENTRTIAPGLRMPGGRNQSPSTRLKMAPFAPIANPKASTAEMVNVGLRRNDLAAYRISRHIEASARTFE
jgi:hypothetical protein